MPRYAFLFALLFVPHPVRGAEFDPKPIDAIVAKSLKEFGAPGAAVVIVKDGEVVCLKGFGVREHHKAEDIMDAYLEAAGIRDEKRAPLFRTAAGKSGRLTGRRMSTVDAYRM